VLPFLSDFKGSGCSRKDITVHWWCNEKNSENLSTDFEVDGILAAAQATPKVGLKKLY
jgi:hypothetical protein